MRALVATLVVLTALLAGCGDKPSDEECQKLLAHVVDLYTPIPAGETLTPQAKKDLETQKEAVEEEIGKKFLAECRDTLPGKQVRCGLKARNEAELAKCEDE